MDKKIDAVKLIQEVQVRPAIWDMAHNDYGDRNKRKQSWEEIVNLFLEETATQDEKKRMGELLLKKWKNLRDRFARDVHERKEKTGSGSRNKAAYMYAQQMMFLKDIIKHHKTKSSMDDSQSGAQSADGEEVSYSNESKFIGEKKRTEDYQVGSSHQSQLMRKKRKLNLVEMKLLKALDDTISRREMRAKLEEDDDRHFLLSLLPAMKFIPTHLKLTARMDLMQCINKYSTYTATLPPLHMYEPQHNYLLQQKHEQPLHQYQQVGHTPHPPSSLTPVRPGSSSDSAEESDMSVFN